MINLNFIRLFFRAQRKHPAIAGINLAGLVIGTLSALFILEYVFYERSFDSYHEKGDRVVRVAYDHYQNGELQWKTANSFYPIGQWLKAHYSEVEDWVVLVRKYNITVSYENSVGSKVFYNEAKTYYASNSLFNLFTIPLLTGGSDCLEKPNTVALSERAARRYFGTSDPIGKVLLVNNSEQYTVTAVYRDIPANSHLKSDFLFSLSTYTDPRPKLQNEWGNDMFHTYLLLAPGVDAAAFCNRAMPELIAQNYQEKVISKNIHDNFYFQPIQSIHLQSNIEYETEPPGNGRIVSLLFGFAIFLLLVAWINYVNLITAQSMERAREIGIRKVNGARRSGLLGQFMREAVWFNLISLALTAILFVLINPAFQQLVGISDFNLFADYRFWVIGLSVLCGGILLSSFYPALVISAYKPITVLKGKFRNSMQGMAIRKALLTVQFIISLVLLIGTIVTWYQARYLMEKSMGVNYRSSLVIRAPRLSGPAEERMEKLKLFKDAVAEMPGFEDCSFVSDIPGEEISNFMGGYRKGFDKSDGQAYYQIATDDHFIDFFQVKVLAGRTFHPNESYEQKTILMNKLAAKRFGYDNPEDAVGKILVNGPDREFQVVGVVDDFHYRSVKLEPMPTIITLNDSRKMYLAVRFRGMAATLPASVDKLRASYAAVFPDQPFDYLSLDDKMNFDLKPDETFAVVFSVFSGLAILVAIIGMIGLILIAISQSVKELGVRKVLGAELSDMVQVLSKQMSWQYLLASLTAVPLAWLAYRHWLSSAYTYRIELSWWYFAVPVLVLLALIASVVAVLARRVLRMNLQQALKYE